MVAGTLTHTTTNEAPAGDLAEEFTHGRSAAWYWRQVLLAILVSVASALRSAAFGLSFAILWSISVTFWGHYVFPGQIQLLLQETSSWCYRFGWPWSTIFAISLLNALFAAPVVAGLSVYLLVSRRFSISRYLLGVQIAFVLQVAQMLVVPGILKHSRGFSAAMVFVTVAITISLGQGAKSDQGNQVRGSIVE